MASRAEILDQNFRSRLSSQQLPKVDLALTPDQFGLSANQLIELFQSQLLSRHLDLESRRLQAQRLAFYTIGSSGHEGMAAVAAVFNHTDMAFLHYRDCAFLIQRAKQLEGQTTLSDLLHSFCASRDDPISGGRHKVLGSKSLYIPPQTSTVASHLPKAVGAAYSIPLSKRMGIEAPLPTDSVILCSFGDASANHSTAQGAINTAAWIAYQNMPLALVFICEDNDIGISTPTPAGWIEANFSQRPGLHYLSCDGLNLLETYQAAKKAEHLARQLHQPVFLHLRTVRLLGHAGSDAEIAYRSQQQIEEIEAQDPLLFSAALLTGHKILDHREVLDFYLKTADKVRKAAQKSDKFEHLNNAQEVMASLIPSTRPKPPVKASKQCREALFAEQPQALQQSQPLARLINWALTDLMLENPNIVLAGEDI
ncbi:MAG: thiamine pyrophosphate-dependent enzyme, partial [Motiliproteus sp.]|nr:thiamine pyrophosphate-dependent enzyme [Motiliproteus sp.]